MDGEPREYSVIRYKEQVKELEEEMNDLEYKLEDEEWEPKIDLKRQIDSLRIHLEEAKGKIDQLESSTKASWPQIKNEIDQDLKGIGTFLKRTASTLEKILLE